jgi:hypothetical protein
MASKIAAPKNGFDSLPLRAFRDWLLDGVAKLERITSKEFPGESRRQRKIRDRLKRDVHRLEKTHQLMNGNPLVGVALSKVKQAEDSISISVFDLARAEENKKFFVACLVERELNTSAYRWIAEGLKERGVNLDVLALKQRFADVARKLSRLNIHTPIYGNSSKTIAPANKSSAALRVVLEQFDLFRSQNQLPECFPGSGIAASTLTELQQEELQRIAALVRAPARGLRTPRQTL